MFLDSAPLLLEPDDLKCLLRFYVLLKTPFLDAGLIHALTTVCEQLWLEVTSVLPSIELVFILHDLHYFLQRIILIKLCDGLFEHFPSLGSWPFLLSEWKNQALHDTGVVRDSAYTRKE
jgi:hypothetical protein